MSGPAAVSIEITSRCNAGCIMCPRTLQPEWHGEDMAFEDVVSLVDQAVAMGVHTILPHHFGEPTMHPEYPAILRWIRHKHPDLRIKVTTNGSKLAEPEILLAVAQCADSTVVSVDGWTNAAMRKMRPRLDPAMVRAAVGRLGAATRRGELWMTMTVVPGENDHEVAGYEDHWRPFGVERFFFAQEICTKPVAVRTSCSRLWRGVSVRVDGRVTPCCRDVPGVHVWGNALLDGLEAVWRGPVAEEWRRAHRAGEQPMCAACDWTHKSDDEGNLL